LGDHPEHLVRLVSGDGRRKVVIANASMMRRQRCASLGSSWNWPGWLAFAWMPRLLRAEQRLRQDLAEVGLAWLRGGNVFMLRYALARSGADAAFRDLLAADALVYAESLFLSFRRMPGVGADDQPRRTPARRG
jgi:dipeptidase E